MKSFKFASITRKLQKGFTLIELAIVGIFLGLLAVFAISMFSNSATDSTRGKSFYELASKVGDNWGILAQSCNISNDITATAVGNSAAATTAKKNFALLVGSSSAISAAYTACYNSSGIRPLSGSVVGSAGAEAVGQTAVTATVGTSSGRTAVATTFTAVPDNVVLYLYNTYSSVSGAATATTLPATADTTDPIIQFGTPTNGARNVTILRAL